MKQINVKRIFHQFILFVLVSGVGWLMDFSIYTLLSYLTDLKVIVINIISSIPAITYVFLLSNKKIFKNEHSRLSLKTKYLLYFAYQLVLLLCISAFGELLYGIFIDVITVPFLLEHLKIVIKILITPITMTVNFIVMKNLIEKL
jgi:putative flippase GtrA